MLLSWIRERVGWIAPILVYPGEDEMLAWLRALSACYGRRGARQY